jgi:hypothetical protein
MTRRKLLQSMCALFAGQGVSDGVLGKALPASSSVKPRHVLCFLGPWKSLSAVEKIVGEFGRGFEFDPAYSAATPDPRMEKAFSASVDRVSRTFTAEDWARVKRHSAVAYVLSPPIDRDRALPVSTAALEITARLIKAGATAVKSESAGIAHGLEHWLHLAQTNALRLAWVRRPIQEGTTLYSCGMHLLGRPDIECADGFEAAEAVRWIDALAEKSIGGGHPAPAHRFSIDGKTREKSLQFVPCKRYAEDDFFFNPYGYVRVSA